jgi:Subtilase family
MRCFFEARRKDGGSGQSDDDSGPGLGPPAALLERHGARVLSADAAEVPGWPAPRSTVYRARTLLVPADLLREPAIGAIRRALARVGLTLIPPPARPQRDGEPGSADVLKRLPRTAVLAPADRAADQAALPVVVDAWVALQTLRAAASARTDPALDTAAVRRISLEHLLTSSAITSSPIWNSSGTTGSPIWNSSGVTGPSSTNSYLYSGDARTPVAVCIDAPARESADYCELTYGRHPVVAVLDTGVRAHPWLDVQADSQAPGGYVTIADGFVAIDQDLQNVIHNESALAAGSGDQPRQLIRYPWDRPITADRLIGEIDTDTGHGTFIAGIVRQVAPDAQVLAIRITHSDGVIYEGDLMCALGRLAARIAAAEAGDLAAMVDVVSLSFGYFSESPADLAFSSGLWVVLDSLLRMGVVVVAAAGNFSTSRRFYPAAFAGRPAPAAPPQAPLISVGALNPNGSKALFSDGGRWITAWATGAAMISTFPTDVNASREPEIAMAARPASSNPAGSSRPAEREALDPDDFSSGFAVWSGTSFSAPLLAAQITAELMAGAQAGPARRLDQRGAAAATGRVTQALQSLGWRPS